MRTSRMSTPLKLQVKRDAFAGLGEVRQKIVQHLPQYVAHVRLTHREPFALNHVIGEAPIF